MAEQAEKKAKAEVTMVKMEDGREVGFAGNRKMVKDYQIDPNGGVEAIIDFRNGKTVRLKADLGLMTTGEDSVPLILKAAGHGLVQKLGDEAASEKDVEDAYMAIEDLAGRLASGEWNVQRESGGFAGASIVVRAIMEHQAEQGKPMTQEAVKAFLQKKLDDAKARGESLSRKQLYDAFRNPQSKIGQKIERMEKEKLSKESKLDADAALAEIQ